MAGAFALGQISGLDGLLTHVRPHARRVPLSDLAIGRNLLRTSVGQPVRSAASLPLFRPLTPSQSPPRPGPSGWSHARNEQRLVACGSESIERCCFHLDRKYACLSGRLDGVGRLAEWSVRRPGCARPDSKVRSSQRLLGQPDKMTIRHAIVRGGQIMIARAFVTQRSCGDDEVGRRLDWENLPGGCDAEDKFASRGE